MSKAIQPAQLAGRTKLPVKYYIDHPAYWMEEKYDGCRVLLFATPWDSTQYNRRGEENRDNPVLDGITYRVPIILDGELLADHYLTFDLLLLGERVIESFPLTDRRVLLERVVTDLDHPRVRLGPVAQTVDDKRLLFNRLLDDGHEGAIFKNKTSTYSHRRTSSWIKWKFTSTMDVIISEIACDGKPESAKMVVYDGNKYRTVGTVKITDRYLREFNIGIGSVVEVRYLYLTGDNKLYQPAFLRVRLDKAPEECTMAQLT